jgi:flavin reductase (DIM6/NTAB) family NADH-FMN oxidoreductase RutF
MASSVTLVDIDEPTLLVCIDTKEKNDPLLQSDVVMIDYLEDPKAGPLEGIVARFRFVCTHVNNITYGSHNVIFFSIDEVHEWPSSSATMVWRRGDTEMVVKQGDPQGLMAA